MINSYFGGWSQDVTFNDVVIQLELILVHTLQDRTNTFSHSTGQRIYLILIVALFYFSLNVTPVLITVFRLLELVSFFLIFGE